MQVIQIIDDDTESSEILSDVLKENNFIIHTKDDTKGAVEYLKDNKPDLLILDVMFPENPSGGFDLAREIRKVSQLKDLPIIFLTSINSELPMDFSADDLDGDWLPAQDFIEKPVDFKLLLGKIHTLLK